MPSSDDEPFDYTRNAGASRDQSNKVAGVKKETGYCDADLSKLPTSEGSSTPSSPDSNAGNEATARIAPPASHRQQKTPISLPPTKPPPMTQSSSKSQKRDAPKHGLSFVIAGSRGGGEWRLIMCRLLVLPHRSWLDVPTNLTKMNNPL